MLTDYKPLTFWSWNGRINEEEVISQINDFAERGFGGFFIHARAGLLIEYMGEKWFDCVKTAIETAQKVGIEVWLYDEDGWPSGFAGGKVPSAGLEYCMKKLVISKSLPEDNYTLLCSYSLKNGEYVVGDSDVELYAYYVTDLHYVDLLNPKTTDKFIENVHEVYKEKFGEYFGSVIKGIFTDEPQLTQPYAYSESLREKFSDLYGYDMLDRLYELYDNEKSSLFRYQYNKACSILMHENFTKKIGEWCEKNNLFFTGHFAGEDGLCSSFFNGIVTRGYPHMQIPGIDFLGRRLTSPVLVKQVSSIKNQYRKQFALSETFGCSGWNVSMEQLAYIWGYQSVLGINKPCYHLSSYTIKGIRKRDYPPFFSYQEPWWDKFKSFNEWCERVNAHNSKGHSINDVAVIMPCATTFANFCYSINLRNISTSFRSLIQSLCEIQVNFDLVDENELVNPIIEKGVAKIKYGRYKTIILPEVDFIEESTLKFLEKAKEEGLNVVFINSHPNVTVNNLCSKPISSEIQQFNLIFNRCELIYKYFNAINYQRPLQIVSAIDNEPIRNLIISTREDDEKRYYAIFNKSTSNITNCILKFKDEQGVSVFDAKNNIYTPIAVKNNIASLVLNPMSLILLCSENKAKDGIDENGYNCSVYYPEMITNKDDNVLTLDYATYSFDGEEFSPMLPITHIQKEIYDKKGKELTVRYYFNVSSCPQKINLCIECEDAKSISINGKEIRCDDNIWWLDKCIKKIDVSKHVKKGINTVCVVYDMYNKNVNDIDGKFETERNRFFYPTEPESIYVVGDFLIKNSGIIHENTNYIRVENSSFFIEKSKKHYKCGDLTTQGFWFYRGTFSSKFLLKKQAKRVFIQVETNSVMTEIVINGKKAGLIYGCYEKLDITRFLTKKVNEICVNYLFSNRNTLGPHHHYFGEPTFVGVNVFNGRKGFEDGLLNPFGPEKTWIDDYTFVYNKVGAIKVYNCIT